MLYLLEKKLPEKKSIFFALSYIYGIGKPTAFLICKKLGFSINLKVSNITQQQSIDILKIIDLSNLLVGNEAKKFKMLALKKLVSIKSYRGIRRSRGFPVRGQRTHTNAKSAKKLNKRSI